MAQFLLPEMDMSSRLARASCEGLLALLLDSARLAWSACSCNLRECPLCHNGIHIVEREPPILSGRTDRFGRFD